MREFSKRRFGQHFLRDTGVLDRIVETVQPTSADLIVEVGAGKGALSLRLAPQVFRFLAIEIDRDLISTLTDVLSPFPQATVFQCDFLKVDIREFLAPHFHQGLRLRITGNLPYNIATAAIERLLSADLQFEDMIFMVQLEVAQRIVASPGSRQYGYLSVHCQHRCHAQIKFKVSPACFVPRPRVDSAVICIRPGKFPLDREFEECFSEVVGAAFTHRRKTIMNSLREHPKLGSLAAELLQHSRIDGRRRAEDLKVSEFESLAAGLQAFRGGSGPAPSRRIDSPGSEKLR